MLVVSNVHRDSLLIVDNPATATMKNLITMVIEKCQDPDMDLRGTGVRVLVKVVMNGMAVPTSVMFKAATDDRSAPKREV
jgi:hypothetical protein